MERELLWIHMMKHGCFDAFDVMMGRQAQNGKAGWLGVYVSKAFRQGHMAVQIGETFFPKVADVFSDEGIYSIDADQEKYIEMCLKDEVKNASGQLVREDEIIYLPIAHGLETQLASEIRRLCAARPFVQKKIEIIEESVNEDQRAAIMGAASSAVCLITGGPGTGKTYTAGVYLRSLMCLSENSCRSNASKSLDASDCVSTVVESREFSCSQSDRNFQEGALASAFDVHPLRVAIVAPTGRAVQTLFSSIKKRTGDKIVLEAKTIHSLIANAQRTFLPYHVVIVDECSMIGSDLMLKLLRSLASGTQLLMLGDPDQLPSIEPGQPFFELLKAADKGYIRHFSLRQCQRTASEALLQMARSLREENVQEFEEMLATKSEDVECIDCRSPEDWKCAERLIDAEVIAPWNNIVSVEQALLQLRTTTCLTPTRKGYWGTQTINKRRGKRLSYLPVVNAKNRYQLDVMNGDMGVLESFSSGDQIHFHHCTVPAVLLLKVEVAFAMTVHKSQGGEFDTVVVIIPPHAIPDRRLLYTAVTREKKRLILIGQKEDMVRAARCKKERLSTLSRFIASHR